MKQFRSPRHKTLLAALLLGAFVIFGLTQVLAQGSFFGYSRILLPVVSRPVPVPTVPSTPTSPPIAPPRIIAWLDSPSKVSINDRLKITVHIENESVNAFTGKTQVTIPYDGRHFYAVDMSFQRGKGDWIKHNRYPNELVVEFGSLGAYEERRGVIYYDFRANGSNAKVGDKFEIGARFNNGRQECGQDTCYTNVRSVEVIDKATSGGIGTLPNGSEQIQKLGNFRYGDLHRWVPAGFRPGEQVTTWLNSAGGGTVPLTLQQKADSSGKVYFNIDVTGLRNGFYSIVAHGKDTRIEIIGEFQVINSPIANLARVDAHAFLIPLPSPVEQTPLLAAARAQPAQVMGNATLTGVVAAAGTNGATRLEGVQVNVVAADGNVVAATATDSFGGYVLNSLPAGTYAVSFDPSFSLSDTARRFQSKTQAGVILADGGTVHLDAELVPGSSVSGQVTGGTEGGLADVSVELLNGNTVVGATTTTADGRYVLDGIPSGTYTLFFDPSIAEDALVQSFAITTSAAFTLTAPDPLGNQDVVLSRTPDNGVITGQLVAADTEAPLAEVFVAFDRFDSATGQFSFTDLALTDENGGYSAVLPHGNYHVSFLPSYSTNPTSARYVNEYFNDTRDPASATQLTVTDGGTVHADGALTLGGSITGTVTGAGQPLADVVVLAYATTDNALVDVALSDETGAYVLSSLPAGSYRVEFATYLSTNTTSRTFASTTRSESVMVTLGGTVSGISAELTLGSALSGSVTSSEGGALASVLVLAINPGDAANPDDDTLAGLTLTDSNGAYTLPGLATGSYTILFDTALTGTPDVVAHFDQYYNAKDSDTTADPVSVTADGTVEGINATLQRGGQIRGEVRDAVGGFTVSGVLVEITTTTDPNTLVAFAITAPDGTYASSALKPGASYLVHFDPEFTAGETRYAAEYFNNAPDAATAQPVSVPTTLPVTGINAALDAVPQP